MKNKFIPTITFLLHKKSSYGRPFFILLILFSLTLFLICCRKYPEDESLSSQTVKTRLTKHDWYYNGFFVNDYDSTANHLKLLTTSTNTRYYHFRIKKFNYGTDGSTMVNYLGGNYVWDNQFSLRIKKRNIYLGIHTPPGSYTFYIEGDYEWVIRKLTKTDFIIEKEFNGNKYRLEFKN